MTAVLARESYSTISLYAPDRTPAEIDLSDNTNLWGIPPQALRAISEVDSSAVTRYPGLYADSVKRAVADYLNISSNMVVTGCGSDDILDSTIRAFGEPGDVIACPDPSFAMIPIFARMNGLTAAPIPLTVSGDADASAFVLARARINYLCSPNNPTGASLLPETVEQIIRNTNGVIMIDEAYAEFAARNCLSLLKLSSRVIITRTLSKAFGLAGLRIGYAIGDPTMVAEIEKARGPYKVNSLAQRAAVAALSDGRVWVDEHVAMARANRSRFASRLESIGLKPLPSESNFLLVPVVDAMRCDRELRMMGIAVRPFTSLNGIGDALRISIGPWSMMERCLEALVKVCP